jgi:hypothetical protein
MTIEEIKAYLAEHADDVEVIAFLTELNPPQEITADKVGEFLKTDDGKLLVQPLIDKATTKAVQTRDKAHEVVLENEVKKRVASELLKLNPEKSPLEIKVQELEENAKRLEEERAKDQLKRQIVEKAAAMGIKPFFIEDYTPPSLEVGELFLQKIKAFNDEVIKNNTNELLSKGYKPNPADDHNRQGKIDISKLSPDELIKMELDGKLDEQLES